MYKILDDAIINISTGDVIIPDKPIKPIKLSFFDYGDNQCYYQVLMSDAVSYIIENNSLNPITHNDNIIYCATDIYNNIIVSGNKHYILFKISNGTNKFVISEQIFISNCKKIYLSDRNIYFVDTDNRLWCTVIGMCKSKDHIRHDITDIFYVDVKRQGYLDQTIYFYEYKDNIINIYGYEKFRRGISYLFKRFNVNDPIQTIYKNLLVINDMVYKISISIENDDCEITNIGTSTNVDLVDKYYN
jgi:hypothetical protein